MANSRQRRTARRTEEREAKTRLWIIAEHPLLASGAGAMFLAGIGTELGGAPKLAALFYLAAIALLVVVFIRANLFRANPKQALIILALTAVALVVLWITMRPSPPLSEKAIAIEVWKQAPQDAEQQQRAKASSTPTADLRSELRADGNRAIRLVTIRLRLKRQYSIDEIGHFRIMYEVATVTDRITPEFYLACQDYYDVNTFVDPKTKQFGYRWTVRYRESNDTYKPTASFSKGRGYGATTGLVPATDVLEASADLYNQIPSDKTLEDLYGKYLYIFVTESLVNKISEVSLQVNNWELFSVKADRLIFQNDKPIAPWFLALSKGERAIPWRSVDVSYDEPLPSALATKFKGQELGWTWSLDPSGLHPKKMPEPELKADPFKE